MTQARTIRENGAMTASTMLLEGVLIYPPRWYLDLARDRLRSLATGSTTGGPGRDPVPAGDRGLLALAQHIVALDGLHALPDPAKWHVLGLDLAEVRLYLRQMAGEIARPGPRPDTPPSAQPDRGTAGAVAREQP